MAAIGSHWEDENCSKVEEKPPAGRLGTIDEMDGLMKIVGEEQRDENVRSSVAALRWEGAPHVLEVLASFAVVFQYLNSDIRGRFGDYAACTYFILDGRVRSFGNEDRALCEEAKCDRLYSSILTDFY